jgi:cupin 2 domain-containing protein
MSGYYGSFLSDLYPALASVELNLDLRGKGESMTKSEHFRPAMAPPVTNLLQKGSDGVAGEQVTRLLESSEFRLERIVSNGEASAPGFWYDQPEAEWVLVIPAHSWHRVDACSQDALWLALHYRASEK